MNAFTSQKTIVGASALAVAGLVTAGFAAPAFADHDVDNSRTESVTESRLTNDLLGDITGDTTLADLLDGSIDGRYGQVGDVTGGDTAIGNGDVSSSSPIVVAPKTGDIASGNAVGSGNDVDAPIASGNDTSVDVGDVVDVNDLVDSALDEVDVDGLVDDVTSEIDVDSVLD